MVRFTEDGGERSGEELAPVIPLFGERIAQPHVERAERTEAPGRPATFSEEYWADDEPFVEEPVAPVVERIDEPVDRDALKESATTSLIRSLGRRGLSIAESKTRLRRDGLTDDETSSVVDDIIERGWLDDTVLAEQLVHSATSRKGMGTRAIRQVLVKRAIARDVIDEVLAELPDDDAERALEFARTKARSLVQYDDQTGMRRLMGMLARRGFGGSIASKAARAALDEERRAAGGSAVRFR